MNSQEFNQRFERNEDNGAFLLSTTGCFMRHNRTRDEQELTKQESRNRNFENHNQAEREERSIQNKLVILFNKGYKLLPDESAESFIARIEEEECSKS